MANANHAFAGSLYRSLPEMLDAIAVAWIAADDALITIFRQNTVITNEEMARECIAGWGLGVPDTEGRSHMDRNVYTVTALARAFRRLNDKMRKEM